MTTKTSNLFALEMHLISALRQNVLPSICLNLVADREAAAQRRVLDLLVGLLLPALVVEPLVRRKCIHIISTGNRSATICACVTLTALRFENISCTAISERNILRTCGPHETVPSKNHIFAMSTF